MQPFSQNNVFKLIHYTRNLLSHNCEELIQYQTQLSSPPVFYQWQIENDDLYLLCILSRNPKFQ